MGTSTSVSPAGTRKVPLDPAGSTVTDSSAPLASVTESVAATTRSGGSDDERESGEGSEPCTSLLGCFHDELLETMMWQRSPAPRAPGTDRDGAPHTRSR